MLLKLIRFNSIIVKRSMASISSTEYSACLTTVSNDEEARKLSRSIVESHLAACVNIIPNIRSVYEWKSTIHEDNELILLIKTKKDLVPKLIEFVKKNHSYEVPELIELPIQNGNPDYLKWIDGIVKQ
ncbi:hypothetical protein I4U23_027672 [Adineta vaga]|nr:hypothetical protein I4U23_027672 [Adineta vaga]